MIALWAWAEMPTRRPARTSSTIILAAGVGLAGPRRTLDGEDGLGVGQPDGDPAPGIDRRLIGSRSAPPRRLGRRSEAADGAGDRGPPGMVRRRRSHRRSPRRRAVRALRASPCRRAAGPSSSARGGGASFFLPRLIRSTPCSSSTSWIVIRATVLVLPAVGSRGSPCGPGAGSVSRWMYDCSSSPTTPVVDEPTERLRLADEVVERQLAQPEVVPPGLAGVAPVPVEQRGQQPAGGLLVGTARPDRPSRPRSGRRPDAASPRTSRPGPRSAGPSRSAAARRSMWNRSSASDRRASSQSRSPRVETQSSRL